MPEISVDALADWLRRFQESVAAHRDELTELDSAIGDADHGANLDRGMTAVVAALDAAPAATATDLFTRTGMALISNVGGASGPLFGTFFLRIGATLGATSGSTAAEFGTALRAGIAGVEARGKAQLGDKTMLDALAPAVEAWDSRVGTGGSMTDIARSAADAAAAGRDATAALVARKGRASYLGDRSTGHVDPGAASTALLFEALAAAVTGAAGAADSDAPAGAAPVGDAE